MLKILLAVKSCQQDMKNGVHQAIRETWAKNLPENVELLFFMGGRWAPHCEKDEIWMRVKEGYWDNFEKTHEFLKWSLQKDYDYLFLTDTDVYIVPELWINSGFENYDYSGNFGPAYSRPAEPPFQPGKRYPDQKDMMGNIISPFYAFCGGAGPFLSRKMVELLASKERVGNLGDDMWIGQVLGPLVERNEIFASHLFNFEGQATFHFNCTLNMGLKDAHGVSRGHLPRLNPAELIRAKHKEFECR